MYYCPEAHGTIISPTATIRQNRHLSVGYQKWINIEHSIGHIELIPREGSDPATIPIYLHNDLCYHHHSHTPITEDDLQYHKHRDLFSANGDLISPTVNRLSDAAKWELWHHRLAHPGNTVMEQQHKHADGVPALRGNAFFRCPSCMKNKLCTKHTGKRTNLGSCRNCARDTPTTGKKTTNTENSDTRDDDSDTESDWDEYLDNLHLPDALPGQHFHIDFGFVRGSDFKVPTGTNGTGPTLTSMDAKNSYCIIVNRATRYIWVHLDNTK